MVIFKSLKGGCVSIMYSLTNQIKPIDRSLSKEHYRIFDNQNKPKQNTTMLQNIP